MKSLRAAATVAAASVLLSLTVAAPSAVAAQGCQSIPMFCAWDAPFFQGNVRNLTDPDPSPLLSPVLGPKICYDLKGPRRSLVNDTGYSAFVYDDANCTSLAAVILPRGYMNEILPPGVNGVVFLPT